MGKNSVIKSLGKCIGNVVMHKILLRYTNKPESKKHLSDEVIDYSQDVFERAQSYTWSSSDKNEIREKAGVRVLTLSRNYPDVKIIFDEVERFIEETMDELLL